MRSALLPLSFLVVLALGACTQPSEQTELKDTKYSDTEPDNEVTVVYAEQDIAKGKVITAADVKEMHSQSGYVGGDTLHSLKDALAHKARQQITKGQILTEDDVCEAK